MRLQLEPLPRKVLRARFRWEIPERFNIAQTLEASAKLHPARTALIEPEGRRVSFSQVSDLAARLAGGLADLGVRPGQAVGIFMGQGLETALAHYALYRLGAIALPIAPVLGTEAIRYRLSHAGATHLIADPELLEARPGAVPESVRLVPKTRLLTLAEGSRPHPIHPTRSGDPAILLYTSGTTGKPKGALLPHRTLIGHLPGFYLYSNFPDPQSPKVYWSPAEWAWAGGLLDVLLPAWVYGFTVVAHRRPRFDPEEALWLMERYEVTHTFLFPTALKMIRSLNRVRQKLHLESVHSGGEPLGEELQAWSREHLGLPVNEFYGQTEANLLVGQCYLTDPIRPGAMGLPFPGHEVVLLDESGHEVPVGVTGEVALKTPDPVAFLGYLNDEARIQAKFLGPYLLTGDLATKDEEGYLWFKARKDNLINVAGYRIGPFEIEEALLSHPDVAQAAVIGVDDPERGQRVVAFVVLRPGAGPNPKLEAELKSRVRQNVGRHATPSEVRFLESLPTTVTGKIQRHRLRALL